MSSTMEEDFTVDKLKDFVQTLLKVLNVKTLGEKVLSDLKESWMYILLGRVTRCGHL